MASERDQTGESRPVEAVPRGINEWLQGVPGIGPQYSNDPRRAAAHDRPHWLGQHSQPHVAAVILREQQQFFDKYPAGAPWMTSDRGRFEGIERYGGSGTRPQEQQFDYAASGMQQAFQHDPLSDPRDPRNRSIYGAYYSSGSPGEGLHRHFPYEDSMGPAWHSARDRNNINEEQERGRRQGFQENVWSSYSRDSLGPLDSPHAADRRHVQQQRQHRDIWTPYDGSRRYGRSRNGGDGPSGGNRRKCAAKASSSRLGRRTGGSRKSFGGSVRNAK